MTTPITEHDLHAYVDEALDAARRAEVESYLADHPADAERVRAYREQNRALAAMFDPVLSEPIPESLATPRRRMSFGIRAGAIAASLVVAASLGWFARGFSGTEPVAVESFAQRALVAHAVYAPEVLHPVEVNAAQEQHLVGWLSKRLGTAVRAPSLHDAGFDLVGGRLLPATPKPAAQFMYQNAQGTRLTLYVTPDTATAATAFRFERSGEVSAFYWVDNNVGYALAGELERPVLLQIAEAVYRGLNR